MSKDRSFAGSLVERFKPLIDRIMALPPVRFFQKYGEDQAGYLAATIAYQALFSMIPILISVLTIVSIFFTDPAVRQTFVDAVGAVLPGRFSEDIASLLNTTTANLSLLGAISIIGLLWSGSALFGAMEYAFARMFRVKQRGMLPKTLISFGMIFVFTILVLLSIGASSMATFLLQVSREALPFDIPFVGTLELFLGWLVSFSSAFLLFFMIYWVIPNVPLGVRQVWPGALLGAALFLLIIQIFPFYAANFANFNRYGALIGLFFLIMTWFYFLAQVLLLGAELNSFLFPKLIGKEKEGVLPVLQHGSSPATPTGREPGSGVETKTDHLKEVVMEDIEQASTADLMRRLVDNVSHLVERQIDLAKIEAKEDLFAGLRAAAILIGGAIVLFLALVSLVVAAILALALLIPGWLSAIIFAVFFGIVGAGLALWGYKKVQIRPMERTREEIEEDLQWIRHPLTSSER